MNNQFGFKDSEREIAGFLPISGDYCALVLKVYIDVDQAMLSIGFSVS